MMKKRLNSSSKRKWIVNGALAFGAVALLTTGFATWIIGANNASSDFQTSVTVDTATRNNINLTFEFLASNNSIYIGEQTKQDGLFVNITDGQDTDFTIGVKITLEVGKDVKDKPTKLVFDWKKEVPVEAEPTGEAVDVNTINHVQATEEMVGTEQGGPRTTGSDYTYVDIDTAVSTLTLPSTTDSNWTTVDVQEDSDFLYVYQGSIKLFKWGTFFENVAPSEFYDGLYSDGKISNSTEDVSQVFDEIDAMHTALNGKNLSLTLTATK